MFATVNGIRLFYDVLNPKLALTAAGADELPTLVCIHGGPGGDHMSLRPEIELLCPSAHVVLFDQRGGGRSDAGPPQQWTLDQWADDFAGVCDALGIVKPIVFGNSGGGMVALRYAVRHPNHAGAFVLVSTAPRIVPADRIADFERRGGPAAGAAARGMFERCAPEDFGPYMRHCLPLYMRRPLSDGAARAARSRFSLDVNRRFFAPGGEAWRMDLRSGLSSISCPTLVLSGIDDPMTPAEMGREIAQAIPNSQFELFEQSSHGLMSDEPDKFAAVVSAFIAKVPMLGAAARGQSAT